MSTFILRRLLELIPTLLGVSILTFALMRLSPGDPVRLMLGPEATQEAIDATSVELGYQRYSGGTPAGGIIASIGEDQLVILPDGGAAGFLSPGGRVRFHLGEAPHPVAGEVVELDGELGLRVRASDVPTPVEGGAVSLVLGSELVRTSLATQYLHWISGVLRGDLGTSITSGRPVSREVFSRMPATIELAVVSMFFAILTGVLVGVFSAVYPRSLLDNTSRIVVFVFLAMPSFWLGLELIILFARNIPLFPPADRGRPWTPAMLSHLVLPSITLGVGTGAFLCRILRSSMLEVLNMDYIRTARAKGLSTGPVVFRHALRNAMIPFVTVAGLSTGALLGGSVIVETVFNWPGVGKLMIDSIRGRDFPVTMGAVLVLAIVFVLVNLVVDLLYALLDPRIRLGGGSK